MTTDNGGVRVRTSKGGFIPLLLLSLAQLKQRLINAMVKYIFAQPYRRGEPRDQHDTSTKWTD